MEFSHYQEVPHNIAEKVLEGIQGRVDLLI
jgi:translation elongation factor EF-G